MTRAFCVSGVSFLTGSLVLLLLVSVSLPFLSALDITRVHFKVPILTAGKGAVDQIRLGIWGTCVESATSSAHTCVHLGHGYSVEILSLSTNQTVVIGSSWTRGLAIHPVAAALTFIAFCLSFSQHVTFTLAASLLSFLAAFLTLIAFCVDIALLAFVRHEFNNVFGSSVSTTTGPGFWLTFVSFFLLLFGGCTVCFGRRRARMDGASSSYPMSYSGKSLWGRFRRN